MKTSPPDVPDEKKNGFGPCFSDPRNSFAEKQKTIFEMSQQEHVVAGIFSSAISPALFDRSYSACAHDSTGGRMLLWQDTIFLGEFHDMSFVGHEKKKLKSNGEKN
jgi:hypothetical protein